MPSVKYIAKRSLIAGVSVSDSIEYVLPVRYAGLVKGRNSFTFERRSISRKAEAYYYTGEDSWSIATIPLEPPQALELEMFLKSAEDRQVFQFAESSTSAYVNAVLVGTYSSAPESLLDRLVAYQFQFAGHP